MDRRSLKTQRLIKDTFLQLLQQKPLQKIAVSEITQIANIGRGTFYVHYSDVDDLYDQIINEAIGNLTKLFDQKYPAVVKKDNDDFVALFRAVTQYLTANATLFKVLLQNQKSGKVMQQIKELFAQRVMAERQFDPNDSTIQVTVAFTTAGAIGVLTDWLTGNLAVSADQLAQIIDTLLAKFSP
ncbi:TetR/AcrR family transcriptional regulator [Levilactobacillus enshiensis]|uniref:TetR/AcrR family transcriptional regulator n=1 Tax=Levilactobacillus enshiensis TaxID=2590213 RepID=UPI00117A272E|nr:TetR/AcrR family transcriptional regulator [Levilactobacillus enshiensis]